MEHPIPEDWWDWWVNPIEDNSQSPDPHDLINTQRYIERTYPKEVRDKIKIKVRKTREYVS